MSQSLKYIYSCVFILVFQQGIYAQSIDSLKNLLKQTSVDSIRNNILNELGRIYYEQGNYNEAFTNHKEALKISIATGDKTGTAGGYNNLGMIREAQGNYVEAIHMLLASLKAWEELKDESHVTATYLNIAIIYMDNKSYEEALKNINKSIQLCKKSGNQIYLGYAYNTLGLVYYYQQKFDKALETHFQALKIREQLEDKSSTADSYLNIGIVYYDLGTELKKQNKTDSASICFDLALKNYMSAKKIMEETGNTQGIANININLGSLSIELEKYADAKTYILKGLEMCKQMGSKEGIKEAYNGLTQLSAASKNAKDELTYYKLYISYRDSLNNEENTKKITRTQLQYEFDKKESAARLEQEKKEVIARAENKKQSIILWSISGVLLLMIAFSVFAYRSYLQKRKANEAITMQKDIIEEKQKEILDSIHYANRIQTALLPSEKYIERILNKLT